MTLHVWLPAIRARSGVDVYTNRLALALRASGAEATITWLPAWREWIPPTSLTPPPGATIVQCNAWTAHAFRDCGLPLVVALHGSCVRDPDWTRDASLAQKIYYSLAVRHWEARSIRAATAIVTVSENVKQSLEKCYGVRSAQVIHNWVDTQVFQPAPAAVRAPGPFRLLFVGNLTRRKGADLLPEIARRLGSGFEIRFVGQRQPPPARTLPPNMIYMAPVNREQDMVALYQGCDALLAPSRLEGFGYAALEAMACGRPVVATRTAAIPEVVRDGETGILCPPDDVDAMTLACRQLATEEELRVRMGTAARQHALARFSAREALDKYLHLYRSIDPASGRPLPLR